VPSDDLSEAIPSSREIARKLSGMLRPDMKGEPVRRTFPILTLHAIEVDGSPIYSWRCAGLEALRRKSKLFNVMHDINRRCLTGPASRDLGVESQVNAASKESPSSEDNRLAVIAASVHRRDTTD